MPHSRVECDADGSPMAAHRRSCWQCRAPWYYVLGVGVSPGQCADAVGGRGHRPRDRPVGYPTLPFAPQDDPMKRLAALLLVVALAGAGAFLWPRSDRTASDAAAGQSPQSPAVAVTVAAAVVKPVPVEFGTIGTVTAYASVAVKSRIDGEIMEVHLK